MTDDYGDPLCFLCHVRCNNLFPRIKIWACDAHKKDAWNVMHARIVEEVTARRHLRNQEPLV